MVLSLMPGRAARRRAWDHQLSFGVSEGLRIRSGPFPQNCHNCGLLASRTKGDRDEEPGVLAQLRGVAACLVLSLRQQPIRDKPCRGE